MRVLRRRESRVESMADEIKRDDPSQRLQTRSRREQEEERERKKIQWLKKNLGKSELINDFLVW
jgi:hypothetical protein